MITKIRTNLLRNFVTSYFCVAHIWSGYTHWGIKNQYYCRMANLSKFTSIFNFVKKYTLQRINLCYTNSK